MLTDSHSPCNELKYHRWFVFVHAGFPVSLIERMDQNELING